MADAQLNILLKLKDEASAGLKTLESNLQSTNSKFSNYQQTLGMARTAGLALTGATAAIGGVALKSAIDYESAFAGVRKTVDATDEEFQALSDGILEMSKRLPQSATEIAGVAEAAGQLGIETGNILGFTETMVKLGMSTNMSSEEAATALARLANITGMPQAEFGKLGSTIVDLGNNLATTEGEIVEMGLRLAGAGATVGMTEAEILGFSGALSSVGIAAESGGTAFSKVMLGMYSATQNGGEALTSFASVAGMTADEFKTKFETDAAGAISAFIGGLGDMQAKGDNVLPVLDSLELGEIRVRDALLRASGATEVFSDAQAIAASAWEENNALEEEAGRRIETTASQLAILKNNFMETAMQIGNALIPALKSVVDAVGPIIEKVGKFASDHPAVVAAIVAIAGAVGGIMLALSTAASVAKGLKAVQMAIQGIGVAMNAASATNPILLALTAIALAAYLIIDNWDKIKPWLEKLWKWVKSGFEKFWNVMKGVFNKVVDWMKEWGILFLGPIGIIIKYWDEIKAFFVGLWDKVKDIFSAALDAIWNVIEVPFNAIKNFVIGVWSGIRDFFVGIWNEIKEHLGIAIAAWQELLSGVWDAVYSKIQAVWNAISGFFVGIWNTISGVFSSALETVKGYVSGAFDKIRSAIDTVMGVFSGIASRILSALSTVAETIKAPFKAAWDKVSEWIETAIGWFREIAGKIVSALSTVAEKIMAPFRTAWDTVGGWIDTAMAWFADIARRIGAGMSTVWEKVTTPFRTAFDTVSGWVDKVVSWFSDIPRRIGSAISGLASVIYAPFKSAVNSIIDALNKVIRGANNLEWKMPDLLGGFTIGLPDIPTIPKLATGGIVTRPTALLAGEAGPEAIIPLNRWNRGGSNVYNITISAGAFVGDRAGADQFAEFILDALRTRQRYSYGAAQF